MRTYLKKLRESKNLTQEEVAQQIGISQNYYCMIENGERQKKMDFPLILKLSKILEVSLEFIAQKEKEAEKTE